MPLLHLESVAKTYVSGAVRTPALRGVDLDVERGEFAAIVGPSGSGKTTLMNVIGCLDTPDAGRVVLDGRDLTGLGARQLADVRLWQIGFVFQSYNLLPVLSALENVEYVLLLRGVAAAERRARSEAVLRELGMEELLHKRPPEMSGGQQQRVAVARAIAAEPALVLADEPTANLDSDTAGRLLDTMRTLNERHGVTFLFSTHDPLVMERARRVVTLHDGLVADDQRR